MNFEFDNFLGGPLTELTEFLKVNNIKYKLIQTEAPKKEANGIKRVLNMKKKEDHYIIIWSYQYY
ncbi:MAG: hypothetical protein ACQESS_06015 [Bacillota bacterium]